jgi:hypothetical protein
MLVLAALPVAVSPAAPRRSLQEAPQHLRWSTTYDTFFPDSRGWINMGLSIYSEMWPGGCSEHATGPGGCGLQAKLAAWKQFGIPSFYDLCDHPCQQSTCPNITNASAPWGEFGSCPIWRKGDGLLPGWEAALEKQVAQQIKPHFGDGKALRGVFLGDELCCWVTDCWNNGLPQLASKLRTLLGADAVLYTNECTPRLQHTGNASWASVQVPKDLDLISVDIYGGPAYGGRDEVAAVRQQYEHGLLPKLHSGQQALLVPGLFVSTCASSFQAAAAVRRARRF